MPLIPNLPRVPERRITLEVIPPTGPGILVNSVPTAKQLHVTARVEKSIGGNPGQAKITVWNLDPLSRDRAAGIIRRPSELDPLASAIKLPAPGLPIPPIPASVTDALLGGGAGQEAAIIASGGGLVRLSAGYDVPACVFAGSADFADSRRAIPNWQTRIEASDGGLCLANGLAAKTFPTGTPFWVVLEYCRTVSGLGPGTPLPAMAPTAVLQTTLRAPFTVMGQARQTLAQALELLEVDWWVDDGMLFMLDRGLALAMPPLRFASVATPGAAQLLDRPEQLADGKVAALAQLSPACRLLAPVALLSLDLPGAYRLVAFAHDLDNKAGTFATQLTLEPLGLAL